MKKCLFTISSLVMISSPVIAIVSCSDKKTKDLTTEIAKLQDFTTVDAANKAENDLSQAVKDANVTTKFNKIREVDSIITRNTLTPGKGKPLLAFLASGISIKKVVVKLPYDTTTQKLVVTVSLADSTSGVVNNTKDVTITFDKLMKDLTTEIAKLQDFTTVDVVNKVGNDFSNDKSGSTAITSKFNLITEVKAALSGNHGNSKPLSAALSSGVSIANVIVKTPYNSATKKLVVIVSLQYTSSLKYKLRSYHKDITITFA